MNFQDKTVLVTGGSSGIGKAICEEFHNQEAKVVVFDLVESDPQYEYYKVDITKEEEIKSALNNIPKIDILVNCAGVYIQKYVEDTTTEELDKVIDTNLKGTYLVTKNVLPLIKQSKGNIINISSGLGIAPELTSPAYCMTKSGIIMLTKCLAQQLAQEHVRVNAVLPGPIDTPLLRDSFSTEEEMEEYKNLNPMKKIGTPKDVASVVLFLASDLANYVTGGLYSVDGGESTSSLYSK
ncbi:SDR family oxidoreductase [Candidatus Dojkabacteria bacterium]|nr:SDR family oxidoreductase [Candidatus Dojkabacteria bacterium]